MSYKPNIELLKKGDRIELTLFYSNYYDNVKKIVLSNNGTSMDVDDLYQDALMVLITYLRDPSFILNVLRISLGITTLPRSSIRLTIPVAFI